MIHIRIALWSYIIYDSHTQSMIHRELYKAAFSLLAIYIWRKASAHEKDLYDSYRHIYKPYHTRIALLFKLAMAEQFRISDCVVCLNRSDTPSLFFYGGFLHSRKARSCARMVFFTSPRLQRLPLGGGAILLLSTHFPSSLFIPEVYFSLVYGTNVGFPIMWAFPTIYQ